MRRSTMKFQIKCEIGAPSSIQAESGLTRGEQELYLAEYSALRDEILKRIETRNQMLSFALVLAGVFLSAGVEERIGVDYAVLLIYPILATFLAAAWAHSDIRAGQIGAYIRTNLGKRLPGTGEWEKYLREEYARPEKGLLRRFEKWLVRHIVEVYASGIFLTTQILAVLLAGYRAKFGFKGVEEIALLILDAVGFALTFFLVLVRRRRYRGFKSRSYWEERSAPAALAMVDELAKTVTTSDAPTELQYRRAYIGLARGGQPCGHVRFQPTKRVLRIKLRLQQADDIEQDLKKAVARRRGDRYRYRNGWYRLTLLEEDISRHSALLEKLLRKACEEWFS